jgi:hypothetical protein
MLVRRLDLPLADRAEGIVCRGADGALGVVVDFIETPLVEGVFTEEMHGWQIQRSTAGLAAA